MVAYLGAHVVVTGGTGALGTAVVSALRAAGAVCHVTNMVAAELDKYPHRDDAGVHITRGLDLARHAVVPCGDEVADRKERAGKHCADFANELAARVSARQS